MPGVMPPEASAIVTIEHEIEDRILAHRSDFGCEGWFAVCNCRAGWRIGVIDLVFLPSTPDQHRAVLVEVKRADSADAPAKVVGQLLLYYSAYLQVGSHGWSHLRRFASEPDKALGINPKSLKMLTGGRIQEDGWAHLKTGIWRLARHEIDLYVGIDARPSVEFQGLLSMLSAQHGLTIGVLSALQDGPLEVWVPGAGPTF
jgi:hypothetical protein